MKQQWRADGKMIVNEPSVPNHVVGKEYGLRFLHEGNPNVLLLVEVFGARSGWRKFQTRAAVDHIIFADSAQENEIVRGCTYSIVRPERHALTAAGGAEEAWRHAIDLHCGTRSPSDWDGTERGFPADAKVFRQCRKCSVLVPDGKRHTCTDLAA